MLISANELHRLGADPTLLIIDCRFDLANPGAGHNAYRDGHIPLARYLDLNRHLSAPVAVHGGRHPLPAIGDFAKCLRAIGANRDTQFVLYDANRGAYACRLWWMLTHAGISRVRILDGGFGAWQAAGLPLTQGEPGQPASGDLVLNDAFAKLWSRDQIIARRPLLVDAREGARYRGEVEPIDPVAGHIPGALNLPWQSATDDAGFFHPPDVQQARWENAGLTAGETCPVVYCGSGVTACVNCFGAALAGLNTALYAGSWSDWCSYLTPENQAQWVATTG